MFFHWLTLWGLGANYLISDGMGRALEHHINDSTALVTDWTTNFHVYAGITFLAVVALGILARLVYADPGPELSGGELLAKLSKATHLLLYILIFVAPALGALSWFAGIDQLGGLHASLINVLVTLAGLHAVAAFYHHYLLKDGLLNRMRWNGINERRGYEGIQ